MTANGYSPLLTLCLKTRLCWSCVHEFDQHDESMDVFVCRLHRKLDENPLAEQVRLKDVARVFLQNQLRGELGDF